jgi:hypothetical protein
VWHCKFRDVTKVRRPLFWFSTLITIVLLIFLSLPLAQGVIFGGDEGYDTMKAATMESGYKLYKDIWNDQPPLMPVLMQGLFRLFGQSILVARLITVGFALVLCAAFCGLIQRRLNLRVAVFGIFFLLTSPTVLILSVSAMKELPAFALMLASAYFFAKANVTVRNRWLLVSGFVAGLALGIKLTCGIVIPAILAQRLLDGSQGRDFRIQIKLAAKDTIVWSLAAAAVFLTIHFVWGAGSVQQSYHSHFDKQSVPGFVDPNSLALPFTLLAGHFDCIVPAIIGVLLLIRKHVLRDHVFPVVMLLTAAAVHSLYRPWWDYYYLHLVIPLAWLAGYALDDALARFSTWWNSSRFSQPIQQTLVVTMMALAMAVFMARSARRFEATYTELRNTPTIAQNPLIVKMRAYSARTHWVYTVPELQIYAFHANLPMPPSLVSVSKKRFWSGQITMQKIVEDCRHYQVEQLLLAPDQFGEEWAQLLVDYTKVAEENGYALYVAKRILNTSE